MNVRLLLIPIISLSLLSGCASFSLFGKPTVKPIEIQTKAVERTPLRLKEPAPLKPRAPKWVVITPENAESVWKDLQEKNVDLVLFAITDDGYEELSITMMEIRNFIETQRTVILKYKEYYEPPEEAPLNK